MHKTRHPRSLAMIILMMVSIGAISTIGPSPFNQDIYGKNRKNDKKKSAKREKRRKRKHRKQETPSYETPALSARHRVIGLAGTVGAPELASIRGSYRFYDVVEINVGYGSFGLKNLMEEYGGFKVQDFEKDITQSLRFVPHLQAGLLSTYAAARWYPFRGGLYGQFRFTKWQFWAHVTAGIENPRAGTDFDLGSMTVVLNQEMFGANIGYQYEVWLNEKVALFFDTGIGYQALSDPTTEIKLGGRLYDWTSFAADLDPAVEAKLNEAKNEVTGKVNGEAQAIRDKFSVLPLVYFSIGMSWDYQ